ncbi:hypothetical protein CORC01_08595 [Colletotrichum orchidophilum]|uniref:Uncharacterized protein n=1 Tax=Colletotrichum orchidophilum TaxID=1209926 RepID=A0A1G4B3R1_9PEZI|nr:uncharacterized protein CORC01_08595 [Colletotrichum orchidophilum]OHE96058.1 hypothetical protein CORC01_08595 [Colletotrichum orchidophilum]
MISLVVRGPLPGIAAASRHHLPALAGWPLLPPLLHLPVSETKLPICKPPTLSPPTTNFPSSHLQEGI